MNTQLIPSEFIWKRLHSLAGLWFTLYLIFHLLTNSQAALLIGDDGAGFIHDVNWIYNLPYLPLLEVSIIGVPILIHAAWGIRILFTSKFNSYGYDGKNPYLTYGRNRAYTWQRITAWILLIGVTLHVIHMRFLEHPIIKKEGKETFFAVPLDRDPGLDTLKERIDFQLLTREQSDKFTKKPLKENEVLAVAHNYGTAELLMVRNTFKSPWMISLYTLFVLTAAFHGINGLWTFMITWGVTLTPHSQRAFLRFSQGLMVVVAFLGLAAIWGTYWINLRN